MRTMATTLLRAAAVALLALAGTALADSGAHYYMPHASHRSGTSPVPGSHHSGVPHDPHGKIQRSARAKAGFKHSHPCPATGKKSGPCHGYVIDHVRPLKQTAKAKDKVE